MLLSTEIRTWADAGDAAIVGVERERAPANHMETLKGPFHFLFFRRREMHLFYYSIHAPRHAAAFDQRSAFALFGTAKPWPIELPLAVGFFEVVHSPHRSYVREGHPAQRADKLRDPGRGERA